MIKKYYSKYTGQQIDEAVAALIENNVRVEDLSQEVLDLIGTTGGSVEIVDIPESIIEKLDGVSLTNPTPVPLTDEEFEIFNSNYETKIYRAPAYPFLGVPSNIFFRFLMESQFEDSDSSIRMFGGNSLIMAQILVKEKAIVLEIDPAIEGAIGVSDLKYDMGQMEDRINNTETEVSNLFDVVNEVSENFNNKADTAYVDSEIARVEGLIGGGEEVTGTAVPNEGFVEKVYFNTSLTPEEVDSIITEANLDYVKMGSVSSYIVVLEHTQHNIMIANVGLMIGVDNAYMVHVQSADLKDDEGYVYISPVAAEALEAPSSGWSIDSNYTLNMMTEVVSEYEYDDGKVAPVGLQNEALKQLISIMPFDAKPIDLLADRVDALEESVNNVYTKTEVNNIIGDINSLLDQINGEVI